MKSKKGIIHNETRKVFERHPYFKNCKKGKIISKNLEKLRKNRNQADYDIEIKFLNKKLIDSKTRSKTILKLLDEFN